MVSSQVAAGPSAPVGPPLSLLPRPLVHVVRQQAPTREGSVPRARGLLNDGAHHHLPRHGGLCHGLPLAYRRGREDREGHHHREEARIHSASSTVFPHKVAQLSLSLSVCRAFLGRGGGSHAGLRRSDHDHSPDLDACTSAAGLVSIELAFIAFWEGPCFFGVKFCWMHKFSGPLHKERFLLSETFKIRMGGKAQNGNIKLQHFYNLRSSSLCPTRPARRWQVRSRRPASDRAARLSRRQNMAIGVLVLVVVVRGGGGK